MLCDWLWHMVSLKTVVRTDITPIREVFKWLSIVTRVSYGFALLYARWLDGTLAPLFNQWEANPSKGSRAFFHACFRLHVFASNSDWLFAVDMIGQNDCFGFGFTTHNWKLFYRFVIHFRTAWDKLIPIFFLLIALQFAVPHDHLNDGRRFRFPQPHVGRKPRNVQRLHQRVHQTTAFSGWLGFLFSISNHN